MNGIPDTDFTCSNWTANGQSGLKFGKYGMSFGDSLGDEWTDANNANCAFKHGLLCLEQ